MPEQQQASNATVTHKIKTALELIAGAYGMHWVAARQLYESCDRGGTGYIVKHDLVELYQKAKGGICHAMRCSVAVCG